MERLNDNEVREVARMQQMIDSYEGFICALHMMMLSEKKYKLSTIYRHQF